MRIEALVTTEPQLLLGNDEIERAYARIRNFLDPTPVLNSQYFGAKYGRHVYLKLENLQPTHSFKVRGALNAVASLSEEEQKRGIICASWGNHGLGIALACFQLKIPCRVVLPTNTPQLRIDAIRRLGAITVLHGDAWDDANNLALSTADEKGCTYIHPFDNAEVMAGQSTVFIELLEQVKELDSVLVSIGGGGLICGVISAIRHFSPKTKVIGVETVGADCLSRSVQAGQIVELAEITSMAESLGVRKTQPRQFTIVSKYADELLVVEDREAIAALVELLNEEKILVELASSCLLAALNTGRIRTNLGKRVAVIMCGGNIAIETVCRFITNNPPAPVG
jgi:threonine dehydratase